MQLSRLQTNKPTQNKLHVASKTAWCLVNTCHAWALYRWVMIKQYTNLLLLMQHIRISVSTTTTTTTTVLRPFFPDHPGELVPEENFRTLWCKGRLTEARGRHTDHPAGRHSIRTNQCPPPPSPHTFLRAGCPSCRQPTVSKHWR